MHTLTSLHPVGSLLSPVRTQDAQWAWGLICDQCAVTEFFFRTRKRLTLILIDAFFFLVLFLIFKVSSMFTQNVGNALTWNLYGHLD